MSCKNCGRETPEGQECCGECLFAALPVKKKSKWKKALIIAGAAVLGVIVFAAAFSFAYNAHIEANRNNPEPLVTSISEVFAAYEKNGRKADLLYHGRTLQITGHTGEDVGVEGHSFVPHCIFELGHEADLMNNDSMFAMVIFEGHTELESKLPPDEIVTVRGRFDGNYSIYTEMVGLPSHLILHNCVIVPDPAES